MSISYSHDYLGKDGMRMFYFNSWDSIAGELPPKLDHLWFEESNNLVKRISMETKEKQWLIAGTKYKLSIWNEEVPIKTISRFEFKASLDGKCGWQFQSDEPSEFAVWLSLIASMGVLLNSTECPIQQVWRLSIYHLLWFLWSLHGNNYISKTMKMIRIW